MALSNLELSLMAFPQSWNAVKQQLNVNLLLLPVGNPLLPLGASLGPPLGTGPQFAGTSISLNAMILAGLEACPILPAQLHSRRRTSRRRPWVPSAYSMRCSPSCRRAPR
jgi:hypothetical protein